jgi:hypothetical protein
MTKSREVILEATIMFESIISDIGRRLEMVLLMRGKVEGRFFNAREVEHSA